MSQLTFTTMKASEFLKVTGSSILACAKILLSSHRTKGTPHAADPKKPLIILANGPSLRKTLAEHSENLQNATTMCVNFMANAPEFTAIRPDYYVLADPHFFTGTQHENVVSLWRNISHADWPMTLFVPTSRLKITQTLLGPKTNVKIATFNCVGIDAFAWLEDMAFSSGRAMPRPRNVLIPSIMLGIQSGYEEIYLTGADHSWLETIRVDENNNVISVQPHFYKDSEAEKSRSVTEYKGYHLHDILKSFYIAFNSYHQIARFAQKKGVKIYNSTEGSYIDAFPRKQLDI